MRVALAACEKYRILAAWDLTFWEGLVEGHDFSRAASRPKPGRLQPPGFTVLISPFIFLQSGYF